MPEAKQQTLAHCWVLGWHTVFLRGILFNKIMYVFCCHLATPMVPDYAFLKVHHLFGVIVSSLF
jgi:hypothetical protein